MEIYHNFYVGIRSAKKRRYGGIIKYRKFSIWGKTFEGMSVGDKESMVSGELVIAAYKNV